MVNDPSDLTAGTTPFPLEDEADPPVHWPTMGSAESVDAWCDLRAWVEALVVRFPHLDSHVIPACWWRHNGYVEALQALRDHERVSFGTSAPGTGAVEWHRAFRDIEGRLREWTRELRCGREHIPQQATIPIPEPNDWRSFVVADAQARGNITAAPIIA